jgi:hypothetical protein
MLSVIWTRFETMIAIAMPIGLVLSVSGAPQGPVASNVLRNAPVTIAVSFSEEIKPILDAKCTQCHGGEDENGVVVKEMELDLTTYETLMAGSEYGSVVEPGDADGSVLWQMLEFGDMPQDGDPLPEDELELFKTWIAEGAENN